MGRQSTYERLYERYGKELVPLAHIAEDLGFRPLTAVTYARRGTLPPPLCAFRGPHTNRWLVRIMDAAAYIDAGCPRRARGRPRKASWDNFGTKPPEKNV